MNASRKVVIVGGGVMGGDIVTVFAAGGWDVHVVTPSQKTRDALPGRVKAGLAKVGADAACYERVRASACFEDVDWPNVNLVVESVTEDLKLKQDLFEEIETLAGPDVPLATNTSNFPIGEVGRKAKRRERILGVHFFMPAHLVPLVEIVSSDATDPAVAQNAFATMKALGKVPIWVKKDVPGFVGNRLQHAMLREALYLVQDGVCDAEGIDAAVRYGFGFRFIACGPILQKEMSGWDTNYLVGKALYPHLYNNDAPPRMLKEMNEGRRIGMKTKHGFWEWTDETIAEEKARIEKALQAGLAILSEEAKSGK